MALKDRLYSVPVVGTALRVQDRYTDDAADQLAASIGFFGFLSLFPLLVLALSVAGYVLVDDPDLQRRLIESITESIPGFSATLEGGEGGSAVQRMLDAVVENRGSVGLIGAVTLLLTGLRVVNAATVATTRVFRLEMPTAFVSLKVRQIGAMTLLGLLAIGGAAAGATVGIDTSGTQALVRSAVGTAASFGFDLVLFLVAYRVLAAREGPPWRVLLPGAIFGAVSWTALKIFGATYVAGQVSRANALYGALGGVIALMLLLYLAGRIFLYGAELIAVRHPQVIAEAATPNAELGQPVRVVSGPDRLGRTAAPAGENPDTAPDAGHDAAPPPPPSEDASMPTRPRSPAPTERSSAISEATEARLEAAVARQRPGRADVRGALAFLIGVGSVAGLVAAIKPWRRGDEDQS